MPTTFVSAFLDLAEDRSKDKSVEKCFGLFGQLAATGIRLHLFLSRCYEGMITAPNVSIEYIELEELDTFKDISGMDYALPSTRTPHHDTKNFMILMNSKIEFVHRAMAARRSNNYAWIDFSIFHVLKDPQAASYLQMLGSASLKPGLYFPGCWDLALPNFSAVCWRFCGGFFIGDAASIAGFYETHRRHFKNLVAQKGLAWEVNVWAWLEYTGHLPCNWFRADHNDTIIRVPPSAFRVVASLTTIPPRATSCRLALDSLLGQVDQIYLSVSRNYRRFGPWTPWDFLSEEPYASKVTVVYGEDDGPATKYLGGLSRISPADWVFVCDDDQEYHPTLVARMMNSVKRIAVYQNHYESIRHKTSGGLIHGYVGLLIHGSLLQGLRLFPLPPAARIVDDQWMSIYCFLKGVPILPSGVETYADIYKVLDGWHEKIGEASLAGLRNRDQMVSELADAFEVRFEGEKIHRLSVGS
jgi:hypothetical protein